MSEYISDPSKDAYFEDSEAIDLPKSVPNGEAQQDFPPLTDPKLAPLADPPVCQARLY
jgi:hypothetical protein